MLSIPLEPGLGEAEEKVGSASLPFHGWGNWSRGVRSLSHVPLFVTSWFLIRVDPGDTGCLLL